jgi:hypothetical protein
MRWRSRIISLPYFNSAVAIIPARDKASSSNIRRFGASDDQDKVILLRV